MNIIEAAIPLKEEKKIKRRSWGDNKYIVLYLNYIQLNEKNKIHMFLNNQGELELCNYMVQKLWEPIIEDLCTDDWEVYEE